MTGILSLSAALGFGIAAFLIELTPGPNMAWLAVVAATEGRRPGFAAVAGVALGLACIGTAAALGVAEFIAVTPIAYEALRWCGVAFLFYLAWDSWREAAAEVAPIGRGGGFYFRRGLITNLLNPKAALFFLTVVPAFTDVTGPLLPQTLALTAIYVAVATAIHAAIVVAAGSVQALIRTPARQRLLRRGFAILLALVAIWFAGSTAR